MSIRFQFGVPCRRTLLALAAAVSTGTAPAYAQGPDAGGGPAISATPPPFTAGEFRARRAALMEALPDGVLLVVGGTSAGAPHVDFTQSPDLRYLTGVTEPGVALVVQKRGEQRSERLFVLPRDPATEVWDGARLGTEGAEARTGIAAQPRAALPFVLDSLLATENRLYVVGRPAGGEEPLTELSLEQQVVGRLLRQRPELEVRSVGQEVQRLRASKSPAELDRIRRAAHITVLAHREAMRLAEPELNEFELHALIEYTFRRNGAERAGFPSIVGSGPNSTTLHYRANDRFLEPGDMIVMDIGASYDGYTADITRTIPAAGRFSTEQREIYETVLAAQKAAEALVRPGVTWDELNGAAAGVLADGLARLGLIEAPDAVFDGPSGPTPQLRLFYMHGLGHGIGLQVHDPDVSYFGPFREGSAFTIEPGIYVRADALDYLPDTRRNRAMIAKLAPTVRRYQGIGVRIEDDYIVTATGTERISAGAPREIAEIEALMREPAQGPARRHPRIVEWYRALQGESR